MSKFQFEMPIDLGTSGYASVTYEIFEADCTTPVETVVVAPAYKTAKTTYESDLDSICVTATYVTSCGEEVTEPVDLGVIDPCVCTLAVTGYTTGTKYESGKGGEPIVIDGDEPLDQFLTLQIESDCDICIACCGFTLNEPKTEEESQTLECAPCTSSKIGGTLNIETLESGLNTISSTCCDVSVDLLYCKCEELGVGIVSGEDVTTGTVISSGGKYGYGFDEDATALTIEYGYADVACYSGEESVIAVVDENGEIIEGITPTVEGELYKTITIIAPEGGFPECFTVQISDSGCNLSYAFVNEYICV